MRDGIPVNNVIGNLADIAFVGMICRPDGKADSARLSEPAFPGFSGSTPDEAYPFPRPAPPVCQAHDKKYILQKQKSQTIKEF